MKPRPESMPPLRVAFLDLGFVIFGCVPGGLAWLAALGYVRTVWDRPSFLLWLLPAPAVLLATFLGMVVLLRRGLPPLKPGVFEAGPNTGFTTWLLHTYLGQALHVAGLAPLVLSLYHLRSLYWRAMGARISPNVSTSFSARIVDLPLITMGPGCTVGSHSQVVAHVFRGDKLLVGEVEIGERTAIGAGCTIGPRTRIGAGAVIGLRCSCLDAEIGDGARIGAGNLVVGTAVPAGAVIDHFAWEHGNPKLGGLGGAEIL